jgi:hypothetical protein
LLLCCFIVVTFFSMFCNFMTYSISYCHYNHTDPWNVYTYICMYSVLSPCSLKESLIGTLPVLLTQTKIQNVFSHEELYFHINTYMYIVSVTWKVFLKLSVPATPPSLVDSKYFVLLIVGRVYKPTGCVKPTDRQTDRQTDITYKLLIGMLDPLR